MMHKKMLIKKGKWIHDRFGLHWFYVVSSHMIVVSV